MLNEDTGALFGHFFDCEPHTHAELLAFACQPRAASSGETPALQTGSRCALCQFPTHAFEPKPNALPAEVIVQINQDFPQWRPGTACARSAQTSTGRALLDAASRCMHHTWNVQTRAGL